jgi:hypothetical protein
MEVKLPPLRRKPECGAAVYPTIYPALLIPFSTGLIKPGAFTVV